MKLNKAALARKIDALARVKAKLRPLLEREHILTSVIKAQGGGESKKWWADVVKQPKKTVVVKAHKQLRLIKKK